MTPERKMAIEPAIHCDHCITELGVGWPSYGPHGEGLKRFHEAHLLIDALRDSLPRYSGAAIYAESEMDR